MAKWFSSAGYDEGYTQVRGGSEEYDEEAGLMTQLSDGAGTMWYKAQQAYDAAVIPRSTWVQFFILLGLGGFFIFVSSLSLPFILVSESRARTFSFFFTIGSVCCVASFIILRGWGPFYEHFNADSTKQGIVVSYVLSLGMTYYSSKMATDGSMMSGWGAWFLCICSICVQVIALLYVLFSYIPGGSSFLSYVLSAVCGSCCPSLFGK